MTEAEIAKPTSEAPYTLFEASVFLSATSLADMRAFFILSFSAGALAFCFTNLLGATASLSAPRETLYVAAIVSFLLSSVVAFYTAFVQAVVDDGKVNIHWNAGGFLNGVDDYVRAHQSLDGVDVTVAQLRFLHSMALVCRRKHAGLRWAMAGLLLGAICHVCSQLVS